MKHCTNIVLQQAAYSYLSPTPEPDNARIAPDQTRRQAELTIGAELENGNFLFQSRLTSEQNSSDTLESEDDNYNPPTEEQHNAEIRMLICSKKPFRELMGLDGPAGNPRSEKEMVIRASRKNTSNA